MEFFDFAYIAQLLMQYTMSFTVDVSADLQTQLEAFVAAYRQAMLIGLCIAAGIYLVCLVMGGIGMHVVKNVKRTFEVNLQSVKINAGGTVKTVKMCTRCIRTGNYEKA